MQTNNRRLFAKGSSFLLLVGIFYFYNTYITVGGFGVGYQYIGCIVLIAIGLCSFLVSPEPAVLIRSAKTAGLLALPYILAMLCSAVIWIFQFTPVRQMIGGFFEPAYMLLCIICAASFAYIFREKTIEYAFWALTAAFFLLLIGRLRQFGPADFINRLITYVSSMGRIGTGISLEETSFSYLYVFFSIYFLFHRGGVPAWRAALRWAIIIFALLDTFKRSGFLALAVGAVIAFAYLKLKGKKRRRFLYAVIIIFTLYSFFVIPFIRYGLFTRIVDALNIDTSARTRIYAYYEQYYTFTPFYTGRGLGWIQRLMAEAERFNVGLQSVNVHCDYVRFYIELGFLGYLVWMLTAFPLLLKKTVGEKSPVDDAVILGVCVAIAMLRLTENISQLYSATLGIGIVIIQCRLNSLNREASSA